METKKDNVPGPHGEGEGGGGVGSGEVDVTDNIKKTEQRETVKDESRKRSLPPERPRA